MNLHGANVLIASEQGKPKAEHRLAVCTANGLAARESNSGSDIRWPDRQHACVPKNACQISRCSSASESRGNSSWKKIPNQKSR
jgi:hypothetical protein